ncbi:MAG: primosomal protein N', partial [Spirochaetales bacterium]|nr:primosomal protein N' [Spirochaetales bacterium]MCF7939142.1 primosomal protein N' [Spirochaetales bacterium]
RSAVFAPVKDPGLVILDEEHEGAYKSGHKPRYHARQVAMHRIRLSEGKLIMGSATPSVEAYHLALEGRLKRIELPSRVAGGTPPNIELVDMRKEKGSVSKRLLEELHAVRGRGGQSILFLNRRGFSYFFHCKSCGYQQLCSNCSVPMTYHKDRDRMICHYCGHVERPLTICPVCGSHDTGYSGFGTERVEEDLHRLLPDFHIARLDTDAARKRGEGARILREMAEGKIDILLGTQMVAKGLDFPSVKLVGVVLADTGLHLPDFRAAERTFSLITQVAGRAGRRSSDGKVLVQTFLPNNPTIQMAVTGDTGSFYDNERRLRSELLFPPFVRMARIVLRGRSSGRVYKAAEQLAGLCREEAQREEAEVEILGPAECPLAVLSGNYRYHLILRSQSFSALHRTVRNGDTRLQRVSGVFEEIDMDPVSLL